MAADKRSEQGMENTKAFQSSQVLCGSPLLVDVTEIAARLVLHSAQVVHGPSEGDVNGFADGRGAALHHF